MAGHRVRPDGPNRGGTAEQRFVLIRTRPVLFKAESMTTYFITGGFGFLGQYIVQAVHAHDPGAELRVLVRRQRPTFLGLEALDGVQWITGDLLQPASYEAALQGVEVVIHNAAMVSFRKSERQQVLDSNITGTRNLAEAAVRAGCRSFIYISSISAVGGRPSVESDESMYPELEARRRTDAYGYSKVVSEQELQGYTDRMRVLTLNPGVVIGPGSDRVEMVSKAVRLLPVLPMLEYTNSFVDVRDVARAVTLALTKGRSGERYIVTAWNIGMLEFTRRALAVLGKKTRILPLSGGGVKLMDAFLWLLDLLKLNPGIRRLSEMNTDKAYSWQKIRREMGWEPAFTLEQSLADTFAAATKKHT